MYGAGKLRYSSRPTRTQERSSLRKDVIHPAPATLEGYGVRLEPLAPEHEDGLRHAATDGRLWELWYTSVPEPEQVGAYIAAARAGQEQGHMLPWAVRELESGIIAGSTRYHDIVAEIDRVEIGYTWYAKRWQRSHVNTPASSCSSSTPSTCSAAAWWPCARTTSTSPRSGRSRRSARRRTA